MEEINVNETMDGVVEVVEEVAKTDSGKVLKVAAGAGIGALIAAGTYVGCKLLNKKVIEPMKAKRRAKSETEKAVESDYDDEAEDC